MRLSIIVAATDEGVIGKTGGMPWYLPADLAHFKEITMGRPIIMGRITHESIGKALPGRRNIVITANKNYQPAEGAEVVGSLDEALGLTKGEDEAFVIGGQSIYEQALPKAQRIYLTRIHANLDGDKFFKYNPSDWKEISMEIHPDDRVNRYPYDFIVLERQT